MSEAVVDASVALKWFVPEIEGDLAERVLTGRGKLHAPDFLVIETANAAWKNWRKGLIEQRVVSSVVQRLPRLVDEWHGDQNLTKEALEMAVDLHHPIFDCIYLVLARRLGLKVVTADRRMLSVAPPNLTIALSTWKS